MTCRWATWQWFGLHVFLQHLACLRPNQFERDYGVYHSTFDDFTWFKKFGDPDFLYEQEMARIYGLEVLRMSSADVLPYDYENYGRKFWFTLRLPGTKARPLWRQGAIFPRHSKRASSAGSGRENTAKAAENTGAADRMNVNCEKQSGAADSRGLPNRPCSPCDLRSGSTPDMQRGDTWVNEAIDRVISAARNNKSRVGGL